jgi:hypothetical protein
MRLVLSSLYLAFVVEALDAVSERSTKNLFLHLCHRRNLRIVLLPNHAAEFGFVGLIAGEHGIQI